MSIRNYFQAETKSGMTIDLEVREKEPGNFEFYSTKVGLSVADASVEIGKDGVPKLAFYNKHANELLLGQYTTGYTRFMGTQADVEAVVNQLKIEKQKEADAQYAQLLNEGVEVTITKIATGAGAAYSTEVEGVSLHQIVKEKMDKAAERLANEGNLSFKLNRFSEMEASVKISELEAANQPTERELKFAEAKRTGKPVLISEEFVFGTGVPREFRDDDGDAGILSTWATPIGFEDQKFKPSY